MLARLPWAHEVEVHVEAPPDELAARIPATLAQLSSDEAGTRLELRADSLEWVAGVLAGLGADFLVIRPLELNEHVARLAERLAASAANTGIRPGKRR